MTSMKSFTAKLLMNTQRLENQSEEINCGML